MIHDDLRRTLLHESRIRDEPKWTILGHGRSPRETARDRGRYLKLVVHESVESAKSDRNITTLVTELRTPIMNNNRLIYQTVLLSKNVPAVIKIV